MKQLRLGVNIDHIATVRNARGGSHPDPVTAALLAQTAGADGITAHLREDRRHILDKDIYALKEATWAVGIMAWVKEEGRNADMVGATGEVRLISKIWRGREGREACGIWIIDLAHALPSDSELIPRPGLQGKAMDRSCSRALGGCLESFS